MGKDDKKNKDQENMVRRLVAYVEKTAALYKKQKEEKR